MARKQLTQLFPFLIPLRQRQRKACFYWKMRLDGNTYARQNSSERLPHMAYETRSSMINPESGFPMEYQYNKVHNLRLAAKTLDGLLIRPGETFSFYQQVRRADRNEPYRDGLNLVHGRIVPSYGGGLCQMSNTLFWLLLHTPLTIVERHAHAVQAFPTPGTLPGTDATVSEGWKDLKLRNDTGDTYQLSIRIEGDELAASVLCGSVPPFRYKIYNGSMDYLQRNGAVYQRAAVHRMRTESATGHTADELLYINLCRIDYALPEDIRIREEEVFI